MYPKYIFTPNPAMEIKNYDDLAKNIETDTIPAPININPFAPRHPFRLLIIGPSGQGKTNVLLNLLTEYIYYDRIYLYAKTATEEDKYLWVRDYLQKVQDAANQRTADADIYEADNIQIIQAWETSLDNLVKVHDLDEQKQNLVVFDDLTLEGRATHDKIAEHFIRGRKKNCSYIYIGHSFYLLPKIIRINISDIILFPPDNKREIGELAKTYATRISFKEFQKILNDIRNDNNSSGNDFVYIDTRAKDLRMWCRRGFDNLLVKPL